jgi:hypothetical protein
MFVALVFFTGLLYLSVDDFATRVKTQGDGQTILRFPTFRFGLLAGHPVRGAVD